MCGGFSTSGVQRMSVVGLLLSCIATSRVGCMRIRLLTMVSLVFPLPLRGWCFPIADNASILAYGQTGSGCVRSSLPTPAGTHVVQRWKSMCMLMALLCILLCCIWCVVARSKTYTYVKKEVSAFVAPRSSDRFIFRMSAHVVRRLVLSESASVLSVCSRPGVPLCSRQSKV
jgi:hypothetical protein